MSDLFSFESLWENRYSSDEYIFGKEPNDFLRERVRDLPPGPVLCIADGEGRNSVFVAQNGHEVTSVDLTVVGPAKTRHLADERGVTVNTITADLEQFDLGLEKWSAVVSIFAHVPCDLRVDLHRRVVAALKPGGVLLLEAYTPEQVGRGTGGPPIPEMTMSLEGLRSELAPLEFIHGAELEREVIEGAGHTGVGCVVQVIAIKATEDGGPK